MGELDKLNLQSFFEIDKDYDSDKYIKIRIRVCHDGVNPNRSSFSLDVIDNAKESIKNIPILAHVVFDEDGVPHFGSHDMHIEKDKANEDEYKLVYEEAPIGVIPETNNYSVEEYNGKNYVFVDGYLFKDYMNYSEEIINREEIVPVSMETIVDSYKYESKTKIYTINEFRYKGITLLGENVGTGMENAKATINQFATSYKEKAILLMSELQNELNKCQDSQEFDIKKQKEMEVRKVLDQKKELLDKFELTSEQLDFNIDDFSVEDLETKLTEFKEKQEFEAKKAQNKNFSATYNQKYEALYNAINAMGSYEFEDENYKSTYFWFCDFDDTYVFVNRVDWVNENRTSQYGRFSYTFDEANTAATLSSEFEEMFIMWLTKPEKDDVDSKRNNYDQVVSDFESYKENYKTSENDVNELREFKAGVEKEKREVAESEVFEQFGELNGVEEFEQLKANCKELSIKEITDKCYTIVGKKQFSFSADKKTTKVKIDSISTANDSEYGGLFEKYGKKNKEEK